MLRPGGGSKVDLNLKGGEGEKGGQSVVRSIYHAGSATCGMLIAFALKAWRRYLENNIDNVSFSTIVEEENVINPRQDVEGTVSGGAPSAVDDVVEPKPMSEQDDDRELESATRVDEAERVGVKQCLQDLQASWCAKKRTVLETVAETFGLVEELLQGGGAVNFPNLTRRVGRTSVRVGRRAPQCARGCESVEDKDERVGKVPAEGDCARDGMMSAFWNELKAANMERWNATEG